MRFLFKIIGTIAGNALGLWLAAQYITGFHLTGDWIQLAKIGLVLAALNFVLKPILKLFLGPIIILTLGFGLIFVNAIVIYGLTFFFENLTIETIPALIYSTILIGIINFLIHLIL